MTKKKGDASGDGTDPAATEADLGGDLLKGLASDPQIRQVVLGGIGKALMELFNKLFHHNKSVVVPAAERPLVDDVPDDKIVAPVLPHNKGYTDLRIKVFKAQYNRELFGPDSKDNQYTDDNPMGLYRPPGQPTYNRRSKIWLDATPFKGTVAVQADEGEKDGIIWKPVWHLTYNGQETTVKANPLILQDTANGSGRPIQVVEGESVGVGFSAWDFARGFLCQIQVGDNEGEYTAWVEIPELSLRSEVLAWKVS